jgi:hypothetical protein
MNMNSTIYSDGFISSSVHLQIKENVKIALSQGADTCEAVSKWEVSLTAETEQWGDFISLLVQAQAKKLKGNGWTTKKHF